jgi:hypothetical protein
MINKIAVIGAGPGGAAIVCIHALQEVFPESDIQQADNIQIDEKKHAFKNPYVKELQFVVAEREVYTPIEVNRKEPRSFIAIGNSRFKPQQVIRRPRYQKCH